MEPFVIASAIAIVNVIIVIVAYVMWVQKKSPADLWEALLIIGGPMLIMSGLFWVAALSDALR